MPNKDQRVNLTLPPEVIAVLDRMSAITGAGRATIVRQWLIEALPMLDAIAKTTEVSVGKNVDILSFALAAIQQAARDAEPDGAVVTSPIRAPRRKRKPS